MTPVFKPGEPVVPRLVVIKIILHNLDPRDQSFYLLVDSLQKFLFQVLLTGVHGFEKLLDLLAHLHIHHEFVDAHYPLPLGELGVRVVSYQIVVFLINIEVFRVLAV